MRLSFMVILKITFSHKSRKTLNKNIIIRKYITADSETLIDIWQLASALAHPFLSKEFMAQATKDMRNLYLPNAQTWVVEQEGKTAGFISLLNNEIGGLFLEPSFIGQGLGKTLVDHCVSLKGPLIVEVFEDNKIGRKFYDRYGFVETGQYDHEPTGQRVLKMKMK